MQRHILLLLICLPALLGAQISVSNLLEYQLGNIPNTEPTNLTTLYDQLNLTYRTDAFTGSVKLESFETANSDLNYRRLSQRSLNWREGDLSVTVGNFYEILGRGTLLRSYEISGTILEDLGFRTRYGFYRDIDGVSLNYSPDRFQFKAFRGRPLRNDFPPLEQFEELRRVDLIEGAEASARIINSVELGGLYLRQNKDADFTEFGGVTISSNLPFDGQFYTEYSQQLGGETRLIDISDGTAHALYSSINLLMGPLGASFEFKDYHDFRLFFNDPPPLVREHSYRLLNRSTHVLLTDDESGYQAEIFYTLNGGHTITANFTRADYGLTEDELFTERFVELAYYINDLTLSKAFLDIAEEAITGESDRITAGLYFERQFGRKMSTVIEVERQQFDRTIFTDPDQIVNTAVSVSVSRAPSLALGVLWENSNDPFQVAALDADGESVNWVGLFGSYRYRQKHLLNFFWGKRRGGPACTSGVCYEVLDFEGFEARLTTHL